MIFNKILTISSCLPCLYVTTKEKDRNSSFNVIATAATIKKAYVIVKAYNKFQTSLMHCLEPRTKRKL